MSKSRIAVLAIHGVGDHQPSEMAKGAANLLQQLADDHQRPRYTAFTESTVRLNVAPMKVEPRVFDSPIYGQARHRIHEKRTWGPMDALYKSDRNFKPAAESDPESIDHLFMEGQLAGYRGGEPDDTYECLRLEGNRLAKAPVGTEEPGAPQSAVPEKTVHIYDMFWSDLSGVNKSGLRIFGELYQLLFHLGSLGLNNIKAAALSFPKRSAARHAWRRFSAAQNFVVAVLAWPIPILNLFILAFTLGLFAIAALYKLPGAGQVIATSTALLAAVLGLVGSILYRKWTLSKIGFKLPVLGFLVAVTAIAIASVAWAFKDNDALNNGSTVCEWTQWIALLLVLGGEFFGIWRMMCAYEKRRPGTKMVFGIVAAITALCSLAVLIYRPFDRPHAAMANSLQLAEVALWLLIFAWIVFWGGMIWAALTGVLAVRATKKQDAAEADRARRVAWTARLTSVLPAALFLLMGFIGWAGIYNAGVPLLPNGGQLIQYQTMDVLKYSSFFARDDVKFAGDWAKEALIQAGIAEALVLLLLICVAAIIGLWGLLPSVLAELLPSHGRIDKPAEKAHLQGDWLDRGLRFTRWGGEFLYAGVVAFPVFVALGILTLRTPSLKFLEVAMQKFAMGLGALVATGGLGLLALGGRLSKLALGFRPVIRVALDVDNWLREHPRDSNPTARICGRYVSLLRYISQWKDEDGRPYDALIIFAHSQGTVITADLLHFLTAEACHEKRGFLAYDESLAGLEELPIYLFTMGCPLRQLYGRRFPYLYGYAPVNGAATSLPDPDDLHLSTWVNAYRSGDYIGRYLWRPHPWQPVEKISHSTWDPPAGVPRHIWADGKRVEFCIGPGAHTHYWDETAEAIAEALDVLVARAPVSSRQAETSQFKQLSCSV